jgi:hypothetical protein
MRGATIKMVKYVFIRPDKSNTKRRSLNDNFIVI